jgi:iron(III) transport system permease protein
VTPLALRSGPGPPRRRRRGAHGAPAVLLVPSLVAAAMSLVPLWYLFDRTRSQGWGTVARELWQRRTSELVVRSFVLTGVVTLGCVLLGVTAAWLVTRSDLPGRRAFAAALALPLAVPSYISAFAWISWRPSLAGFAGAALVLTLASFPYVYLPTAAALSRLDPTLDDVARSLGRSRWRVAIGLSLRQARPAVATGTLATALYVLSDFGAVGTMRYEAFTWVIYGAYRNGFNPARAAILALPLVAAATLLTVADVRARGRLARYRLGSGTARPAPPVPLGRARVPAALALLALLGASVGFPVAFVLRWMVDGAAAGRPWAALGGAVANTVLLAGAAALASAALAVPLGVLVARFPTRLAHALDGSTWVAHALPGIVLAISIVYVGVRLLRPIYQTSTLLVLAYVMLYLPLAAGAVRSVAALTSPRVDEAARSLGYSPAAVLRHVTLPLVRPGALTGAALVFLMAAKELPATLLLRPTGTHTLASAMWQHTSVSDYGAAGPYALALLATTAVPAALLTRGTNAR